MIKFLIILFAVILFFKIFKKSLKINFLKFHELVSERKGIQNASLYNQKMIHSKGIEERKRMSYSAEHDGSISDILRKQNIVCY